MDIHLTGIAAVQYNYDSRRFQPPAPIIQMRLAAPRSNTQMEVMALLDSGAAISVVPMTLVEQLRLPRVDMVRVRGFGGDTREVPVFAAQIALSQRNAWLARLVPWAESYAILGRDAMNRWRIVLDGPRGMANIG